MAAICSERVDVARLLIAQSADVKYVRAFLRAALPPLPLSSHAHPTNTVGAAIPSSVQDTQGQTAAHWVAMIGNLELAKLLHKSPTGAPNWNAQNHRGETPYYLASREGHVPMCKFLLDTAMVDPSIVDFQGHVAPDVVAVANEKRAFQAAAINATPLRRIEGAVPRAGAHKKMGSRERTEGRGRTESWHSARSLPRS